MDLQDVESGGIDWIELAQDLGQVVGSDEHGN